MAFGFIKKTWKDRISEYPTRRTLTKEDGSTELVTVSRSEGTVSQEGDAYCADNMNDLEKRVDDALNEANSNLTVRYNQESDTIQIRDAEGNWHDWASGGLKEIKALIPIMTSNTTPSGQAMSSSGTAYYAFNNSASSEWYSSSNSNQWVGYRFPKNVCIKKVTIQLANQWGLGSFRVEASDDGNNWEIIKDNTSYTNTTSIQTFEFENNKYCKYYRIYCNESGSGDVYIRIGEIQMLGY